MLSIKRLTVSVEKKEILHNVSIAFRPGKVYAIMGPNGSGKSTLARSIMGDPIFHIKRGGTIVLGRGKRAQNLEKLTADRRAHAGIFLSAQSPLSIPGVTVRDLVRVTMKEAMKQTGRTALDVKRELERIAVELKIPEELLNRSLNEGFSGGERKKMEILQMALFDPTYIFLDEVDTGVDVDALATIAQFLKKYIKGTKKTLIIITHATRILRYLTPDQTIIIRDGRIVKKGDDSLAKEIEKTGFIKN